MDHLDPLKNNGKLTASNVIPACSSCNSSKKDHQWMAWFQKQEFYDKKRAEKIVEYIDFILSLPKN
ncbi:HNH endonuclease [Enterococcus faecalis]|uniref:HNH endonuclease n=1 Tax=Enterococcus faecalis TaxID=1351 RepID=UPI00404227EE